MRNFFYSNIFKYYALQLIDRKFFLDFLNISRWQNARIGFW